MTVITKSDYVNFIKCPNLYYLNKFHPNLATKPNEDAILRMENGKEIGLLAQSYFGNDFIVIERGHGISLKDTIDATTTAIKNGHKIICEASFIYKDLYCAVDILKINDDNTVEIYEVKSSTAIKDTQIDDVSFQSYVLTKLGYKVKVNAILHPDAAYRFHIAFDLCKYFTINQYVADLTKVENNINKIRAITKNPALIAKTECDGCPFFDYCFKDLPKDRNIFKLVGISPYPLYNAGIKTFEDVYHNQDVLKTSKGKWSIKGERALQQIEFELFNKPIFVNKVKLKAWLDSLIKPYYFLDFEAVNDLIPFIEGEEPNFTRIMQYSIHKLDDINQDIPKPIPYLQDDGIKDNLETVAEKLIQDLGNKGSILVYSSYEKNRILALIKKCPKYTKGLMAILDRLVDMEKPFNMTSGSKNNQHNDRYVYDRKQLGRSSIKYVLPAYCPEYDGKYKALPFVHNGSQINRYYLALNDMSLPLKERKEIKDGMIEYCSLDTEAEVAILKVLFELAK